MTTAGSRKPPEPFAEPVATLLNGLHLRGLAVGPDDARRLAAVFRHAGDWSRRRRVRALKALLARGPEESRMIDQLTPFLFVEAEDRVPPESASAPKSTDGDGSAAPPRPGKRGEREFAADPGSAKADPRGSHRAPGLRAPGPRARWWIGILVLAILTLSALLATQSRPRSGGGEAFESARAPVPTPAPDLTPAVPQQPCEVREPPAPPRWPFWLILAGAVPLVALFALRRHRFVHQERNLEALVRSTGTRTYRLRPPSATLPLDPELVREAAFHLSAPSVEAPARWLDTRRTVEETLRRAGRLALRFATWREHRTLVFIEDVSPEMAAFPDHGRQLAEAMRRQGSDVVHYFMNGQPDMISDRRDLTRCQPLHQVLAGFDAPAVVVLGVAAGLDRLETALEARWIGALRREVWLHPQSADLWGPGARWLARQLRVVPLDGEGLLRLGTPARGDGDLPPRWRPAEPSERKRPEAMLASLRASLGSDGLAWLGACAAIDRLGLLTARLAWALRGEGVVPVALELLERAFELKSVRIAPDGGMTISEPLRDALLAHLSAENPKLLSRVVAWAERKIEADLPALESVDCPAQVTARGLLARLLFLDPRRRHEGRRQMRALATAGYGAWLTGSADDSERETWNVRLARQRKPAPLVAVLAAGLALASLAFLGSRDLQALLSTSRPDFALYPTPVSELPPGTVLKICDRYQLHDRVRARVGRRQKILPPSGQDASGAVFWTLDVHDPQLFQDVGRPAVAELHLSYPSAPRSEQSFPLRLGDAIEVQLAEKSRTTDLVPSPPPAPETPAPETPPTVRTVSVTLVAKGDVLGRVSLQWGRRASLESGVRWAVYRNDVQIGNPSSASYQDRLWETSGGPWVYRVEGGGAEVFYLSGEIAPDLPAGAFKVIVNASNSTHSLSRKEISKIFLKSSVDFFPVNLRRWKVDVVRAAFSKNIHNRSVPSVDSFWQHQLFSGGKAPPAQLDSEQAVMEHVSSVQDGIGYVSLATTLIPGVKVIEVSDWTWPPSG